MALEPITRKEQIIAGKDLQPITRTEKFLKQYGGASSWNDLKDKPFGEEVTEVELEYFARNELLLEGMPVFSIGDTVNIKVNGIDYSLVAFDDDGYVTIGDKYSEIDNGNIGLCGYQVYIHPTNKCPAFYAVENKTVSYKVNITHTIDPKFLPEALQFYDSRAEHVYSYNYDGNIEGKETFIMASPDGLQSFTFVKLTGDTSMLFNMPYNYVLVDTVEIYEDGTSLAHSSEITPYDIEDMYSEIANAGACTPMMISDAYLIAIEPNVIGLPNGLWFFLGFAQSGTCTMTVHTGELKAMDKKFLPTNTVAPSFLELESGTTRSEGYPVCIESNYTAKDCKAGDPVVGRWIRELDDNGDDIYKVQLRGEMSFNYTGTTAPTLGYCKLVANGFGGLKVSEDGREILVLSVDTENRRVVVYM